MTSRDDRLAMSLVDSDDEELQNLFGPEELQSLSRPAQSVSSSTLPASCPLEDLLGPPTPPADAEPVSPHALALFPDEALARKRPRDDEQSDEDTTPRSASVESARSLADGLAADENWKTHETSFDSRGRPVRPGIVNQLTRLTLGRTASEGRRLLWCLHKLFRLISRDTEHKIGLAYDAKVRWEYYAKADDADWKPDVMVLLERASSREAAGFLEAALISAVQNCGQYHMQQNSMNLCRRDIGGTGPRYQENRFMPHYIYVCIQYKPGWQTC